MNRWTKPIFCMLAIVLLTGLFGRVAGAGQDPAGGECAGNPGAADEWIVMRLETAYLFNPFLNSPSIDVKAKDGAVTLSGTVGSDVRRDLAEEIAKSIDGVRTVESTLEVRDESQMLAPPNADSDFLQKVMDATTTAQVKTRLIGNDSIAARDIDVDTENNVVRLSGKVRSASEKQLAELIARNTSGVHSVFNELEIRRSG